MPYIYAMSDIHGELEVFKETFHALDFHNKENMLILLGDYLDRRCERLDIFDYIKNLQERYEKQVVVLKGNHELMFLEEAQDRIVSVDEKRIIEWLQSLPYFYETAAQIFIHAGVDEEAEELWKHAHEDFYFAWKYPHSTGRFYKDIIAGHVFTSEITGNPDYHKVYWDKESHYYIDGQTEKSKIIPILKYDTDTKKYTSFEKTTQSDGSFIWSEYKIE